MSIYKRLKALVALGLRYRKAETTGCEFIPGVRDEFDTQLRDSMQLLESFKGKSVPTTTVPDNFKENAQGGFTPIERIAPIDLLRDEMVQKIIEEARAIHLQIKEFKENTLAEIITFLELSASEHNRKFGGKKGNVQLTSFDGKHKVMRKNQDFITFDERLVIAKDMLLEVARDWASHPGVPADITILIEGHFRLNKNGQVSVSEVMSLRNYPIQDPRWKEAMKILQDGIQVHLTVTYLRFFERVGNTDEYKPISLDIASV